MMYLSPMSGERRAWRHPGVGWIITPAADFGVPDDVAWAADCGLKVAMSPDQAVVAEYVAWLSGLSYNRARCLYAVAPDVLGDAAACWERSVPWLPQIRALGYPVAFVAQNGFNADAVDWNAFDVLFIGGKPGGVEWKRRDDGGYAAIQDGKARGKWVHVGRVNGAGYLRHLAATGADSADGSLLCHGPDKWWPLITGALDRIDREPPQGRPMELPLWV